jgi:hypothetical protein
VSNVIYCLSFLFFSFLFFSLLSSYFLSPYKLVNPIMQQLYDANGNPVDMSMFQQIPTQTQQTQQPSRTVPIPANPQPSIPVDTPPAYSAYTTPPLGPEKQYVQQPQYAQQQQKYVQQPQYAQQQPQYVQQPQQYAQQQQQYVQQVPVQQVPVQQVPVQQVQYVPVQQVPVQQQQPQQQQQQTGSNGPSVGKTMVGVMGGVMLANALTRPRAAVVVRPGPRRVARRRL